ncbi:DUF937 domain-containing protein [Methylobacterium sp. Leaf118]|uniref:DUF937 domain-containing protein n=1 Tax=Methylobacterium sp. Leaf118 TaxID=2876562 RepID=UPI003FA55AFD
MYTMFDILQSQGDASVKAFGQQFGLSPEQTRRAMEALLPALTMGLQRNASADPMGIARMFGLGTPAGAQPADLMSGLFGSPMLGQAVIQQAAAASGVGSQALRQMLPIMAGMIVAGIVHLMLNPPAAPAAEPTPAPLGMGHLWTDWLNGLSAMASTQAAAPPPPPRPQMRKETPQAPPAADTTKASMEVISQMLQTGAEVQEQNVKAMREVFDAFWSPPKEAAKTEPAPAAPKPGPFSSRVAEPPVGPGPETPSAPPPRRKPAGKA